MNMVEKKSHFIISISIEDNPENRNNLRVLKALAQKDGWSLSQLFREAVSEYAKRHHPGNPQLVLAHWTEGLEMPRTLRKDKLDREEETIRRLVERGRRLDEAEK